MAEICKWESDTRFDEDLRKIEHYQIHPEMLPFIGTQYKDTRILLVGESHYINDISKSNDTIQNYYKKCWYEQPLPNDFPNEWWFNTRIIIHNFLSLKRSRAHNMFRNPSNELLKVWKFKNVCDSDAFNTCAFMNYFQRPASEFGESINNTDIDDKISYETLRKVINIIKAETVIFLSQKAFNSYSEFCKENNINNLNNVNIDSVAHPTCSHWHGENGKEKFINIIYEKNLSVSLKSIPKISTDTIINKIKPFFSEFEIVNRKNFKKLSTIEIYGNNNVNEIVWRKVLIDGRRIGIGYRFDYRLIWIWDYCKKEYLDDEDCLENEQLNHLYKSIISFIQNI